MRHHVGRGGAILPETTLPESGSDWLIILSSMIWLTWIIGLVCFGLFNWIQELTFQELTWNRGTDSSLFFVYGTDFVEISLPVHDNVSFILATFN